MGKNIFQLYLIFLSCMTVNAFAESTDTLQIHSVSQDSLPSLNGVGGYNLIIGYDEQGVCKVRIFYGGAGNKNNKLVVYSYTNFAKESAVFVAPSQTTEISIASDKDFEILKTAMNQLPINSQSALKFLERGERINSQCPIKINYMTTADKVLSWRNVSLNLGPANSVSKIVSVEIPICD